MWEGASYASCIQYHVGCTPHAQAHARLMARGTVTQQDAAVAVMLLEACSTAQGARLAGSHLHSGFPADPDAEHLEAEARLLAALNAHREAAVDYD